MAGNNDLHPILRKIHKSIGDLRANVREVGQEVRKVQEAIQQATERVLEAIDENTKAQAELRMIDYTAEVESLKPKIQAKNDRINEEKTELDHKLEAVSDRYADKHEDLDEKASDRIRDVGSHIFEIDEQEFEAGIEDPFLDNITSVWSTFVDHNASVVGDRQTTIKQETSGVNEQINSFIGKQQELLSQIAGNRVNHWDDDVGHETIQFPYYIVTVERGSTEEQHLYVPAEVHQVTNQGQSDDIRFEEYDGLRDLVNPPVETGTDTYRSRQQIVEKIPALLESDATFHDYESLFESAIGERVQVTNEGGHD